ncbi:ATP-binding protein [Deinococcus gobiensis]|nr:AAA family ATPase [Deinococcus gobiensis]
MRGFENASIQFDFPVTAIIGRNGGGKTTILGAAACLYESIKPRQFFAKSGALDNSMQGWKMSYEAVDKSVSTRDVIRKNATFTSSKWSRDTLKRDVLVFGVIRTLPASERTEMKKLASNNYEIDDKQIEAMATDVSLAVSKILGKDINKFSHIKIDKLGRISLLAGVTADGKSYSEFHFGAGESSVIRMVMKLEGPLIIRWF